MIYCATPNTREVQQAVRDGKLGALLTPLSWKGANEEIAVDFPWVALDNGCFSKAWEEGRWLKWLDTMQDRKPECLFAVVPDVVSDPEGTAARWKQYAPIVRDMGYPLAYVAQDGVQPDDLPWDDFDALFVGGGTEFKLSHSAYALAHEAKTRGKWAHMGRVNSFQRLRAAAAGGYDSADGTYLAFGPDKNLPKLLAWLEWLDRHPPLALETLV